MAIFEEGGLPAVRASVHRQMQVMFPGVDIPQPTSDVFHRPKVRRAACLPCVRACNARCS